MNGTINGKIEKILSDPNSSENERILAICIIDLKEDLKYIKKMLWFLLTLQASVIVTLISVFLQH